MIFSQHESETLLKLLRWRRDVRHFLPQPVPQACLARLRQAMELAPSVGNSRPWRVVRVVSAGLREAVYRNFQEHNQAALANYPPEDQLAYARLKLAGLQEAPEHLAVFTEQDPAAGRGLGRSTMSQTLEQSTAMAIFSLCLAARAENLGVGLVSILDPFEMQRLLGVPAHWAFSSYLCLGWPSQTDRLPLLHRVGWQTNEATTWQEA